jgi:hypothetical protein
MSESVTFEPGKYITKVNGGDYLEVKWRLVWLRNAHPDADIHSKMMSHDGNQAVFKTHIAIPGGGSATGWGSETADDFRDYIEKAETKSIGRALAALGYGTQFTDEYADAAAGRIADAPIDISRTRLSHNGESSGGGSVATPKQVKFIYAIAREIGLSDEELNDRSQELFGRPVESLSRRDASEIIEKLRGGQVGVAAPERPNDKLPAEEKYDERPAVTDVNAEVTSAQLSYLYDAARKAKANMTQIKKDANKRYKVATLSELNQTAWYGYIDRIEAGEFSEGSQ